MKRLDFEKERRLTEKVRTRRDAKIAKEEAFKLKIAKWEKEGAEEAAGYNFAVEAMFLQAEGMVQANVRTGIGILIEYEDPFLNEVEIDMQNSFLAEKAAERLLSSVINNGEVIYLS